MTRKAQIQPLLPSFEGDDPDWVQAPPWAPETPTPPPAEPSSE